MQKKLLRTSLFGFSKTEVCDYIARVNDEFNGKKYTSYSLHPEGTATIQSMEIINLKHFLVEVLGAIIE